MNELQCDNLWQTIKKLAKKPGQRRAAVAYVTSDEHVKFRKGDVLVTDASDHAIASGQTDAKLLDEASQRDAKLFSIPGLHCKVLVLGGTAIIGSANLSATSETRVEAAWVSDHPTAVSMASSLVESLIEQAEEIDPEFLERIKAIEVLKKPWTGGGIHKKPKVRLHRPRIWIIGVYELTREFPSEATALKEGQEIAEKLRTNEGSEVGWLRWDRKSRFATEAQRGDNVIQIWRTNKNERPSFVYRQVPILHRQAEPTCTRFYIEWFPDLEQTALTWHAFQKLTKKIELPGRVGPNSGRLIGQGYADALDALWNK